MQGLELWKVSTCGTVRIKFGSSSVKMHVSGHTHARLHTRKQTWGHVHAHTHMHIHTHVRAHTNTHTHTHTYDDDFLFKIPCVVMSTISSKKKKRKNIKCQ